MRRRCAGYRGGDRVPAAGQGAAVQLRGLWHAADRGEHDQLLGEEVLVVDRRARDRPGHERPDRRCRGARQLRDAGLRALQPERGPDTIALDTWPQWNATDTSSGNGLWWTNKIPSGPGSQAQPIPWASFQALYPTAVVGGYGINIGSNNPNTTVAGDGVVFGAATADF